MDQNVYLQNTTIFNRNNVELKRNNILQNLHSRNANYQKGGGGISRRGRRMRLSACDFGDVTRVQWLQHIDGRRCGRRALGWLRRCLLIG